MAYYPSDSTYQQINLNSDIRLNWTFFATGDEYSITDIMDVMPDMNNHRIALPNATLTNKGQNFLLNNISAYSFELVAYDGITNIATIEAGEIRFIYLENKATTNGMWRIIPFGGGSNAITSLQATSSDSSINITNGTLTPPGGNVDFKLPISLSNLNNLATTGIPVVRTINPITFRTVDLVAGDNIAIDNPDGINGDPVISLSSSMVGINSVAVGNFTISGSILDANDVNSDLSFSTNGTGKLNFNGVTIDTNNNIANINDISFTGRLSSPYLAKASCMFTDSITGSSNSIVIESQANIASITGSNGTYVINFNTPMDNIHYGVLITLGSTAGPLPPPVYHGFWTVRSKHSVTIAIVDASGEFVSSLPDGVSVMVI